MNQPDRACTLPHAAVGATWRALVAALACALGSVLAIPAAAQSLVLKRSIELPDVRGRLDHLAIDSEGHRLFVAAFGAGSLEVVDLVAARRVARIGPLGEPQGVAYLASSRRLVVASGSSGRVDAYDAIGSAGAAGVGHLDDADNLRFDADADELLLGYGHSLAVLDPRTLRVTRQWQLAGHPEAFAVDPGGRVVYVNVPSAAQIAVIDRGSDRVAATWPVAGASGNFAMAIDPASRRLFVVTRRPALLLAYDVASGRRVSELPICGDADDLFFDAARKHLYAVCGDGKVAVIRQRDADHYDAIEQIATAPGARTGLFAAADSTLFVAAPAGAGVAARVLVYGIR